VVSPAPLWYAQLVEGRRPEIAIIDDRTRLDEQLGEPHGRDRRQYRLTRGGGSPVTERLAHLSYFFPAHNEEANLRGLVHEALETLPAIAESFEIIVVDDGSRDSTGQIADELATTHPDIVRVVHHETNLGYGSALLSGFRAARHEFVAFTDGDRQFRVADLARLTERLAQPDLPDAVVGFRIKRADPLVRTLYARAYRVANLAWFGLRIRDVDCACKLFRREALAGIAVESGGAFFSAELLIKLRAAGRVLVEVGVPHHRRAAGSPTGAKPSVVFRAVRDFWRLRLRMWVDRSRALRRGTPILVD
jgi:glycosyltransferase involved in cell wall biosynthesis